MRASRGRRCVVGGSPSSATSESPARRRVVFLRWRPVAVAEPQETMAPKKPKKPTQAELIQTLLAQVAELRGRIERMEARTPNVSVADQWPDDPPPPANWWSWLTGG